MLIELSERHVLAGYVVGVVMIIVKNSQRFGAGLVVAEDAALYSAIIFRRRKMYLNDFRKEHEHWHDD